MLPSQRPRLPIPELFVCLIIGLALLGLSLPAYALPTQTTPTDHTAAQQTITIPDICFGASDCSTAQVKITGITADATTENGQPVFAATGTLELNLPGNQQSTTISFISNDEVGSVINGTVGQIVLNVAQATLELDNVTLSSSGLAVGTAVLTLPASLGGRDVLVDDVQITQNGLSIGGGSFELPDIKIGDGNRLRIIDPTATLGTTGGGYTFGFAGTLVVNLPQNQRNITISASIDTQGNLQATVDDLDLELANATLGIEVLTLSNDGLTSDRGTLTLSSAFNGAEGSITDIAIDSNGLSVGGGAATVPFGSFSLGGSNGFSVTDASVTIEVDSAQQFELTLAGTVEVAISGSSASASGSITVNSSGNISGTISAFSLSVAGFELQIDNATINGATFEIERARLEVPPEWGGAQAELLNVRISPSGLSIGGGSFNLPPIQAGGFTIEANGSFRQVAGGYEITASGLFDIPSLGGAAGCSGVAVSLTLFSDATGRLVMEIEPLEEEEDAYVKVKGETDDVLTALRGQEYEQAAVELAAVRLRQVSLTLDCSIPIGSTGFAVTQLRGEITLNSGSTTVSVGLTVATTLRLGSLGPVIRGEASASVTTDPFEMSLAGSLYVFVFRVGGSEISISERSGFRAELTINMIWGQGELEVQAWSQSGQFFLTGKASISIGLSRGSLFRGCLRHPCCSFRCRGCRVRIFRRCIIPRCRLSCRLCNGPCITVPRRNITLARVGAEFGRFVRGSGDTWGFKGSVRILGISAGFFINERGGIRIGNVNDIRLVTAPQIAKVRDAWQQVVTDNAASATPQDLTGWSKNGISFPNQTTSIVTVNLPETADTVFSLGRETEVPNLTLRAPDGTEITPTNLPEGVLYDEEVEYQLAPTYDLSSTLLSGINPALLNRAVIEGIDTSHDAPALAAYCDVQEDQLVHTLGQLGISQTSSDGWVRVLNLSNDQASFDVLIDGALVQADVAANSAAPYDFLTIGQHTITLTEPGNPNIVLATVNYIAQEGVYQSLILAGSNGQYDLLTFTDDQDEPESGIARVRMVHATPNGNPADLVSANDGVLLFADVEYGTDSGYVDIEPGTYNLEVIETGTEQVVATSNQTLNDGDVITVYVGSIGLAGSKVTYVPLMRSVAAAAPVLTAAAPAQGSTQGQQLDVQITPVVDVAPTGRIRLLVADGLRVDGTLSLVDGDNLADNPVFDNVEAGMITPYFENETGDVLVTLFEDGNTTTPLLQQMITVERGVDYTLVVLPGTGSTTEGLVLTDNNSFPSIGQAKVRFTHLDPQLGGVTVRAVPQVGNFIDLGASFNYRGSSDYRELPPGTYTFEVRDATNSNLIRSLADVTLVEGYVYTIPVLGSYGGVPQGITLLTDVEASRYTQEFYTVTNAAAGEWQMIVNNDPGGSGNVGDDATYLLQVLGSDPVPVLSDVMATNTGQEEFEVSWRLVSDDPDTTVTIYATEGPITTTQTFQDGQGNPVEATVPIYTGQVVVQDIVAAVDGTPQSTRIDLSGFETGNYFFWIEADDTRNEPTRAYATRTTGVAAVTIDSVTGLEVMQVDQLYVAPIDQGPDWVTTWTANINAVASYRSIDMSWAAHPSPDTDKYEVLIDGPEFDSTTTFAVGDALTTSIPGLTPGATYTLRVRGLDEQNGRTAETDPIQVRVLDAPFTLTAAAPLETLWTQPIVGQIILTSEADTFWYPAPAALSVPNPPEGISVTFDGPTPVTCTRAPEANPNLFCPTRSGTVVNIEISSTGTMRTGAYDLTIVAVGGGVQRELTLPLNVQGSNFQIALSSDAGTLPLTAGSEVTFDLSVNGFNTNAAPTSLIIEQPAGVAVAYIVNGQRQSTPPLLAGGETVTVVLSPSTTDGAVLEPGTYPVNITGLNDAWRSTATFQLTITN